MGFGTSLAIDEQTYRGKVQLNGFVESEEQARKALAAARDVEGVRDVRNNPQLKSAAAGR